METVVLTIEDIRAIVQHVGLDAMMDEMIRHLRISLRQFDDQTTVIPIRKGFEYTHPEIGLLEWMPAMQRGDNAVIKIVGYHPTNPRMRHLPTVLSSVSAYDTISGHLIGVADGTFLTALRTGAASAVISESLAKPDAKIIGMIGCGAQAISQLHALSRVFDFERVLIYDSDPAVSGSFAERASFANLPVSGVALEELVTTSDIICTATSVEIGKGPVFEDVGLKPWVHINAVGSDFPGKVEVPISVLRRSFVSPDFLGQAEKEGECQMLSPEEIGPGWVEVIKNPDRYKHVQQQMSVFDSTGWALEDLIALEMFLEYARELKLGQRLHIESVSKDPHDPYHFVHADLSKKAPEPLSFSQKEKQVV